MRSNASQRRKTKKQKNYKISVLFPRSRVISKSGTIYAVNRFSPEESFVTKFCGNRPQNCGVKRNNIIAVVGTNLTIIVSRPAAVTLMNNSNHSPRQL